MTNCGKRFNLAEIKSKQMAIEALKLSLIQYIMETQDEKRLQRLYVVVQSEENMLERLAKPMRKTLDIEQLKKEQGFQPINKKQFFQQLDDLEIEEPIEELLAMI